MIEFDGVTKHYPGAAEAAVQAFSLTVPKGSTTVLVGSSGCGKTTLLRMVNRMVDPTSGVIRLDGEDVATRDRVTLRRSIGYVMQDSGLLPHRTVLQNVAVVPRLAGRTAATARSRALDLLELVGLDPDLAGRYPAQLSGGQRQRVGVARGLAAEGDLLLMDEPFGAVDPLVRAELQAELLHLQRELNRTILFITHDVDEAFLLGDQVVILSRGGRVEQRGTPAEVLAAPANEFVASFVGANRRDRRLRIQDHDGVPLVLDARDRPVGVLAPDTLPATGRPR